MKIGKIALIGGAVVAALSGMTIAACSSSNATGNPSGGDSGVTPTGDSGGNTTTDSGGNTTTDSGGNTTTDSGTGGGDGSAACGTAPSIHMNPAGDIFCGYPADGGSGFDCLSDAGQMCCLGGSIGGGAYDPEQCFAFGGACPNPVGKGSPIECNAPADCTANGVVGAACCLQGATGLPAPYASCGYDKLSGGTAVSCEVADGGAADGAASGTPACATGETQLCNTAADCPTGFTTCTPFKWKIYDLGFCTP